MKLNLEQIKSVAVGTAKVYVEDGFFHFDKATEKQKDAWMETGLGRSVPATTGVRLDFHTNSKTFSFSAFVENSRHEVLVDGETVFFKSLTKENDSAKINLDGKEHRITLLLPFHSKGVLKSVEIDDGASFTPHKFDCKIMFYGDSLTQGWHSSQDSLGYAFRVSQYFNAESVILGNGGTIFTPKAVTGDHPFKPELLIVSYGTNDFDKAQEMSKVRDDAKAFLDNIVKYYKDIPKVGITPTWRKDLATPRPCGTFEELVETIKSEYLAHGLYVVEGTSLFPHDPELLMDSVHPGDKCFELYAKNLIPHLEKLLKK